MINQSLWKNEWDNELRLLPQVETITNFDLQLTENVFLLWQFLKLYHSSSPQTRSIVDFLASKTPEALQWGKHIDDVMTRGAAKAQQLFNVLISQGKKIQMKYARRRLSEHLSYYPIKNFIILEKINTGSVGQVHLALDGKTGIFVAAKAIDKSTTQGDLGLFKKLKEEIILSSRMNHPNVVKTMSVLESKDKIIQIMEYCDGGDLISYVRNKLYLDESSAQYFFKKIVQGLKYMHSNNIAHRDLKPENIFLCKKQLSQKEKTLIRIGKMPSCSEYDLKIGDFGASCINEKNKLHFDIVGTLSYAAPEVLGCTHSTGYDGKKADVWSLGIILYAMFFGLLPFDNEEKDIKEAYNEIMKKKITLPKNRAHKFSENAKNLLFGMLNINPNKRFTLQQVISHKWLEDYAKNKLEISHLNKKVNVPFSSTVACPIYPVKQLLNLNQNVLLHPPHSKISQVGKMGNLTKYTNMANADKGIHVESPDITEKGGRSYAFPNNIKEKSSMYDSPSHDQIRLSNVNFSDYQNLKYFNNDDLSVFNKTSIFYNHSNIHPNHDAYHLDKLLNNHDSYNDLLLQYSADGIGTEISNINGNINGNKNGNTNANNINTNINTNINANTKLLYKNYLDQIDSSVDSQILHDVVNTYRKGEPINSPLDKTSYEKVHFAENGFSETTSDRNTYEYFNKYINSPFYKNNEPVLIDYEMNGKKYYDDKTHQAGKTVENMLIKPTTENNFYYTKKEIKNALIQNYHFVQKPKEMLETSCANNPKNTKLLNFDNLESSVMIPDYEKVKNQSTENGYNNPYNRNVNYNINQLLYKTGEMTTNTQVESANVPCKYYYYNKENGMYYGSVEDVNNFADNLTPGVLPVKQYMFSSGTNNCFVADSGKNNVDNKYESASNTYVLNESSFLLMNSEVQNINEIKNYNQCTNNYQINYANNYANSYAKNYPAPNSGNYSRGFSEYVSSINEMHYQIPLSGNTECYMNKKEDKTVYRTGLHKECAQDASSTIYANKEFVNKEFVNKEFVNKEFVNKEFAKKENVVKDGQGIAFVTKNAVTCGESVDGMKKEKRNCVKDVGKKEKSGKEKEKDKEKKEVGADVNKTAEKTHCDKNNHVKSTVVETKIDKLKSRNEIELGTNIINAKKKERKNKEGKQLHGKNTFCPNINDEVVKNVNERELTNSGSINMNANKQKDTLRNNTKEAKVELAGLNVRIESSFKQKIIKNEEINDAANVCENAEIVITCENYYLSEKGNVASNEKELKEQAGLMRDLKELGKENKNIKENNEAENSSVEREGITKKKTINTNHINCKETSDINIMNETIEHEKGKEPQSKNTKISAAYLQPLETDDKETQDVPPTDTSANIYYSNVLSFFKNVHLGYKKKSSIEKTADMPNKEKGENIQRKEKKKERKKDNKKENEIKKGTESDETENKIEKESQQKGIDQDTNKLENGLDNYNAYTSSDGIAENSNIDEDNIVDIVEEAVRMEKQKEEKEEENKRNGNKAFSMDVTEEEKDKEEGGKKRKELLENPEKNNDDCVAYFSKEKGITIEEVDCDEKRLSKVFPKNDSVYCSSDIRYDKKKEAHQSCKGSAIRNEHTENSHALNGLNQLKLDEGKNNIYIDDNKKSERKSEKYIQQKISSCHLKRCNTSDLTEVNKTVDSFRSNNFMYSPECKSISSKNYVNSVVVGEKKIKIPNSLKKERRKKDIDTNDVDCNRVLAVDYNNCTSIKENVQKKNVEHEEFSNIFKYEESEKQMKHQLNKRFKKTENRSTVEVFMCNDVDKNISFGNRNSFYIDGTDSSSSSLTVSANDQLNVLDTSNHSNTGANYCHFSNFISTYEKKPYVIKKNKNKCECFSVQNKNLLSDIKRSISENDRNVRNGESEEKAEIENRKINNLFINEHEVISNEKDFVKVKNEIYYHEENKIEEQKNEAYEAEAEDEDEIQKSSNERSFLEKSNNSNSNSNSNIFHLETELEKLCDKMCKKCDELLKVDKPLIELYLEEFPNEQVDGSEDIDLVNKNAESTELQNMNYDTLHAKDTFAIQDTCVEQGDLNDIESDKGETNKTTNSSGSFKIDSEMIQEVCENIRNIFKLEFIGEGNKKDILHTEVKKKIEDSSASSGSNSNELKGVDINSSISNTRKMQNIMKSDIATVSNSSNNMELDGNHIPNDSTNSNDTVEKMRNAKHKKESYEQRETFSNKEENTPKSAEQKTVIMCEECSPMIKQISNETEGMCFSFVDAQKKENKLSNVHCVDSDFILKKKDDILFHWSFKNEKSVIETENVEKGYACLVEKAEISNDDLNQITADKMEKSIEKCLDKADYSLMNETKKKVEKKTQLPSVDIFPFLKKESKSETFEIHNAGQFLMDVNTGKKCRNISETRITKLKEKVTENNNNFSNINNRESVILDISNKIKNNCVYIQNQNYEISKTKKNIGSKNANEKINADISGKNVSNSSRDLSSSHLSNDLNSKLFYDIDYAENVNNFNRIMLSAFSPNNNYMYIPSSSPSKNIYNLNESALNSFITSSNYYYPNSIAEGNSNCQQKKDLQSNTRMNKSFIHLFSNPYTSTGTGVFKTANNSFNKNMNLHTNASIHTNMRNTYVSGCRQGISKPNLFVKSNVKSKIDADFTQNKMKWMNIFTRNSQKLETKGNFAK